eukprot:jgi/Bigna1/77256/fgenesh1_pg.46_\
MLFVTGSVDLPFADGLNIMVVTDVHSWISGHKQPDSSPPKDADYGDLYSFYYHVKQEAQALNRDLFLVNNGDIVDGTGLSDPNGYPLTGPLLTMMPFDLVNTGNHELYNDATIGNINAPNGFGAHFSGRYVTTNVVNSTTGQRLGTNYTILMGAASGRKYTTFGFLYNMQNHCPSVEVRMVEQVVMEPWFATALQQGEASFVLAHMDVRNELVSVIRNRTRAIMGANYPIIFLTGHTHYRGYHQIDDYAVSYEAGHYFDTVGFISASLTTVPAAGGGSVIIPPTFAHVNVDANRAVLASRCGYPLNGTGFHTSTGLKVLIKERIKQARARLRLDEVIGCSPFPSRLRSSSDELWDVFNNQVVPFGLRIQDRTSYFSIFSRGGFRYDLWPGNITKDEVITLSPFHNDFYVGRGVSGTDLLALLQRAQYNSFAKSNTTTILASRSYDVITDSYDAANIQHALQAVGSSVQMVREESSTSPDTTTIWLNFVAAKWPCDTGATTTCTTCECSTNSCEKPKEGEKDSSNERIVLAISVTVFVTVFRAMGAIVYFMAPCINDKQQPTSYSDELSMSVAGKDRIDTNSCSVAVDAEILEEEEEDDGELIA